MSTVNSNLQIERPKRPCEFTFTWSIHNYSYCTMEQFVCLDSPDFAVKFLRDAKWWLSLRADPGGYLSCYLNEHIRETYCNFSLSIRKCDGQFKETDEDYFDPNVEGNGCSEFVSLEGLKSPDGFLVNDTLTVRCRIWKTGTDILSSSKCDVHSRIKVSKLVYKWTLDRNAALNTFEYSFNETVNITEFFLDGPILQIKVLTEGSSGDDALSFGIEIVEPKKKYFIISIIHFLDANGRVVHSARGEHVFEASNQTVDWKFPLISKDKLLGNKNVYIPKGQLSLRCELSFSTDKLETFEFQTTNDIEPQPDPNLQEVWMENMRRYCEDGKFGDFIIHTPNREFPVSRTVLAAHSEVFEAMFERDMKEKNSGMVNIEDIDDDTVAKMLIYVYTNRLCDIDCSMALKLYFAADKYRITALQELCSNYLMRSLDTSNVCNILELADTHQDVDLKSCARDFVHAHAQAVINSDSWKKLTQTNLSLTNETMQWMICTKFLV